MTPGKLSRPASANSLTVNGLPPPAAESMGNTNNTGSGHVSRAGAAAKSENGKYGSSAMAKRTPTPLPAYRAPVGGGGGTGIPNLVGSNNGSQAATVKRAVVQMGSSSNGWQQNVIGGKVVGRRKKATQV